MAETRNGRRREVTRRLHERLALLGSPTRAVGSLLRSAREAQGLSQESTVELASERYGRLSRAAISAIESGRNLPSLGLLVVLARTLHLRPVEIIRRAERARALPTSLAELSRGELQRRATDSFWAGDFAGAVASYDALLERLLIDPPQGGDERARAFGAAEVERAAALRRCGDLPAARASAEQAVAYGYRNTETRVKAYTLLGSVLGQQGRVPVATDATERAVQLAEHADAHVRAFAWLQRGAVLFRARRYREAWDAYRNAGDWFRKAADPKHLVHVEGNIGECLIGLGHRKHGRRSLVRAVELARETAMPASEAHWLVELGRESLDHGDGSRAERYLDLALTIARPRSHLPTMFRAEWLLHRLRLRNERGRPDRNRVAYLRRLYVRIEDHDGMPEVREFKHRYVVPASAASTVR